MTWCFRFWYETFRIEGMLLRWYFGRGWIFMRETSKGLSLGELLASFLGELLVVLIRNQPSRPPNGAY